MRVTDVARLESGPIRIPKSVLFTIKKRINACGINRRTLFPDLAGLAAKLRDARVERADRSLERIDRHGCHDGRIDAAGEAEDHVLASDARLIVATLTDQFDRAKAKRAMEAPQPNDAASAKAQAMVSPSQVVAVVLVRSTTE